MRSRIVAFAAIALAIAAVAFTIPRVFGRAGPAPIARASLPPKLTSYLGVFERGAPPGYQPLTVFGNAVGREPDLVGYFSGWAEPFDRPFANAVHAHGAILFVQIDPTYASITELAAGAYDSYLRSYADSVRDFGKPVVIGFGHEMNGTWYPWGRVSPAAFVAAWRHIVSVFRGEGALNVTWLWTVNAADRPGVRPASRWWPGRKYVTWIGIDGFYYRHSDTFRTIFAATIKQVRGFAPDTPLLLAETSVGPRAGQFLKIPDLFRGMKDYKTLGLVWFDINQAVGPVSPYHQDWHIEDNPNGLAVFRLSLQHQMKPGILSH